MDQLRPSLDINSQTIIPPPENSVSIPQNPSVQNSTTREFDIDNIKPENKLFTVDLMGEDADVKFASIKTPDARPDVNNQNTSYINPSPGINNSTGMSSIGMPLIKSRDELRSGVKAAIMVVDYVISLIAMKIAGDTRQNAHTADTSQKKLLEDVIVEYLFGKQKAMPLWLTLVFAIAGSYGLIIFAAIRQRSQITKNKKLAQSKEAPISKYRETPVFNNPQENTHYGPSINQEVSKNTQEIPKKYTETTPANFQGGIPKEKLILNKAYLDKNKDGVMEPVNNTSFTDTINPPKKSSPEYPDETIIADSSIHLRHLVSKGIYPMFKKNLDGKPKKVVYKDGLPLMAGRPGKLIKGK